MVTGRGIIIICSAASTVTFPAFSLLIIIFVILTLPFLRFKFSIPDFYAPFQSLKCFTNGMSSAQSSSSVYPKLISLDSATGLKINTKGL